MKCKCKEHSRNYSIQMAKTRKHPRVVLEKKVAELASLITSISSDELLKEYNLCKLELDQVFVRVNNLWG